VGTVLITGTVEVEHSSLPSLIIHPAAQRRTGTLSQSEVKILLILSAALEPLQTVS